MARRSPAPMAPACRTFPGSPGGPGSRRGMRSSSRCRFWIRGRPCSARSVLRPTPSVRAMRWKKSLKPPGRPTRERNRRGRSRRRGLRPSMARTSGFWRAWTVFGLVLGLLTSVLVLLAGGAPPPLHSREHAITIDATALNPPTRWHVPGVTPIIWSMDPAYTEALRTTEPRELRLQPGTYRFGTFTFDFPFKVTLEGVLEFASSLDQCVTGRGTQTLTVRCSQPQPYSGQRDY